MKRKIIHIVLAVTILMLFLLFPATRMLDNFIYDSKISFIHYFSTKSEADDVDIVLVEIDRKTLDAGSGRIGYQENARLLKQIGQAGAKCVVFSFLPRGNSPSAAGKEEFLAQMSEIPVFLVSYFDQEKFRPLSKRLVEPDQQLLQKASGRGVIYAGYPDRPLRHKPIATEFNDRTIPSIELVVSAFLKDVPNSRIYYKKNAIYLDSEKIPVDENNYAFFTPPARDYFPRYSYVDLLDKKIDLKDKTVIVSWSAEEDLFVNMPEVKPRKDSYAFSIASTINTIWNGIPIRELPTWLEVIILVFLAASIGFFVPMVRTERIPIITAVIIFALFLFNLLIFKMGINLSAGAINLTILVFGLYAWLIDNQKTKSMGSQFVHTKLVKLLQNENNENPEGKMQTVVRKAAILFSDIKGYTTFAERHSPGELMDILNEYVKKMNNIVENHGGVVLNYQGDSLMAIFGLTENIHYEKEAAVQAVKTAISMQREIDELRRLWQLEGREIFVAGIGVCVGEIAVGALGNDSFRQYTAVGDPVNEAARLQALAKEMKASIVVGDKAHSLVKDTFKCTKLQQTFLKGKFQASSVYQVEENIDNAEIMSSSPELVFSEKKTSIGKKSGKINELEKMTRASLSKSSSIESEDEFEEIKKTFLKDM
jgi:class 3 adenylate cyclase/CHASE2 domain-containing sensor protein